MEERKAQIELDKVVSFKRKTIKLFLMVWLHRHIILSLFLGINCALLWSGLGLISIVKINKESGLKVWWNILTKNN